MPPKVVPKHLDDGKDEIISAFVQLSSALNNAAKVVETYTSALSNGGISVQAAGEGYVAAIRALGGAEIKAEASPVVGKKRGRLPVGDELESGKKKRRMKKEKDPNAPKRPASAYLLYQNDKRAEFTEKFKGSPYHEMLAKISESWGKLSEVEKSPYLSAQAKLKEDYEGRKKAYESSKTDAIPAPDAIDEDEDELLDTSPVPAKAATNGEAESEDDDDTDDEDEEDEADQVNSIVAKRKGADDEEEEEEEDDDDDDASETSEDNEPPRKKTKGAAPAASTKMPAQTAAKAVGKPASKPTSKKAAEVPAVAKEKKKKKAKE